MSTNRASATAKRPRYVVRTPAVAAAPTLDADQRSVVDHPGGPLLVLAGPGTGKTTTLVEAVVDRVERRGADPESVLALTFSRKAADQLRERVDARLGRTVASTRSATFHSFAYALVRQYGTDEAYQAPLRLLSAAEQDAVIRELLARGGVAHEDWPDRLAGALRTRGFAQEVAAVIARTQERGIGFERLRAIGEAEARPELIAAARFMADYDAILSEQSLLDFPGLIAQAVALLQDPENPARDALRERFQHVFVDEYQDTDPAQVALLKALAGDGRNLIAVGDPHQSIYGFRGADLRGILQFPEVFLTADRAPAPVVVLKTTRRFGRQIAEATGRLQTRMPLPGASAGVLQAARLAPEPIQAAPVGRVDVLTFDTERAEAEHIADLLRRAHLEDGLAWSQLAVLVRSGRGSIPALRRVLQAAGVPTETAADETPLAREPAVLTLLSGLRAAAELAGVGGGDWFDPERVQALLTSPLGGLDASDVRALARALRQHEVRQAEHDERDARPSPELLVAALADPGFLGEVAARSGADVPGPAKAAALARLLAECADLVRAGAPVEQALWLLWQATAWPARLRASALRGGAGARPAHRDLDAVVALFDAAARAESQRGHTGVASFVESLEGQQIPADTLAERGVRGAGVRLLTVHRAKGLEWELVVVASVQEETFPDLRRRTSLLGADRLDRQGLIAPPTARELLAEERRLFYVACTRARTRLVVTAVASAEDTGAQPSRFLAELGVSIQQISGRPRRPLSLAGLVAELRRHLVDPEISEGLRDAAAHRLAMLSRVRPGGRPLAPAADPSTWWGTREFTRSEAPLVPPDEPVAVSASMLTEIGVCPARWFMERGAAGQEVANQAQGFGNLAHALADRIGRGEADKDGAVDAAAVDHLLRQVAEVWGQVPFRTPWSSDREFAELRAGLARFVAWHSRADARELLATEQGFRSDCTLPNGEQVTLRGFADRLELDSEGRIVVVDLKTGKYPAEKVAEHAQLGLYQLAVASGAFDDLLAGAEPGPESDPEPNAPGPEPDPDPGPDLNTREPGGAELWQLRLESVGSLKVQRQLPPVRDEEGWLPVERKLADAVEILRDESLVTRPGTHCSRCPFQRFCPAVTAKAVLG